MPMQGELCFERFRRHAIERPDATWLITEGRRYSWESALTEVTRVATALRSYGIMPGARVLIAAGNCAETVWVHLASIGIGALTVPVDPGQSHSYFQHVLGLTNPSLIAYSRRSAAPGLLDIVKDPPCRALDIDGGVTAAPSLRQATVVPPGRTLWAESPAEPAGILFTSGTTGAPKGVLSVGYDMEPVRELQRGSGVADQSRWYTCLPLYHANALYLSLLGSIYFGRELVLGERFSRHTFWDEVRASGATTFNVVGGLSQLLLTSDSEFRFERAAPVLSAGTRWRVKEELEERFNLRIVEWYGMTDTPGILANFAQIPGAVGKPIGDIEFAVRETSVEDVGGTARTAGELSTTGAAVGELLIRHPRGRITTYWANEAATEAAYWGDWFRTGDLVSRDEAGNYYFKGRTKRMVRRLGENISAWEVETALAAHPAVEGTAVFGVPDEVTGEEVYALVALRRDHSDVTADELGRWCLANLPRSRAPRYIRIVEDIAVGASFRPIVTEHSLATDDPQLWDARRVRQHDSRSQRIGGGS